MPFKDGDFLLVDYTLVVKETNELIVTTRAEDAKKYGKYREGETYGPKLVVLGEGLLLKSIEEEIKKMKEGEEKTFTLPPEKAFGKRDKRKIRIIPVRKLHRRGIVPRLNTIIELDGRKGIIKSIGGGRVVVDFNHPYAGKHIKCYVKVVKKIESLDDKVKALIQRRMPGIDVKNVKVEVANNEVKVSFPKEVLYTSQIHKVKLGLLTDIARYIPEIYTVTFIERFELKKPEKAKEEAKAKAEAKQA